jgi:tripartite ATP-independent transporter DctP family solute receptor
VPERNDVADGQSHFANPAAAGAELKSSGLSRRSFIAGSAGLLAAPAAVAGFASVAASSFPKPAIAQTAKIVAKYGHDSGTTSGNHAMGEYFAGRVAQLTAGEVEVQIYPTSQLGSSVEMAQAVKQGTLEFAFPTSSIAGSVVAPELGVFGLPYVVKSWYQSSRIENSQVAELLREKALGQGVNVLAFAPNAHRIILYNIKDGGKPILKVEDVEGIKMRCIETPVDVAAWTACGALPTPVSFGEVYSAVQQHVVDAVDNAFNSAAGIRLEEVINAVTLTGHRYEIDMFITNQAWFSSLSPSVQDAMRTAAVEASIYQQARVMWDDIQLPDLWAQTHGVTVHVPEKDGFIKKMTSIYPQFEERFGKETIHLAESV